MGEAQESVPQQRNARSCAKRRKDVRCLPLGQPLPNVGLKQVIRENNINVVPFLGEHIVKEVETLLHRNVLLKANCFNLLLN